MTTLRSIVGYIPFRELTQIVDSESIGFAFAVIYVLILVGILSNLVIASLFLMLKSFEEKLQVILQNLSLHVKYSFRQTCIFAIGRYGIPNGSAARHYRKSLLQYECFR